MTDPVISHVRQTTYAAMPGWVPSKVRHREFPVIDTPTVAVGSDGRRDKSGLLIACVIGGACAAVFMTPIILSALRG